MVVATDSMPRECPAVVAGTLCRSHPPMLLRGLFAPGPGWRRPRPHSVAGTHRLRSVLTGRTRPSGAHAAGWGDHQHTAKRNAGESPPQHLPRHLRDAPLSGQRASSWFIPILLPPVTIDLP